MQLCCHGNGPFEAGFPLPIGTSSGVCRVRATLRVGGYVGPSDQPAGLVLPRGRPAPALQGDRCCQAREGGRVWLYALFLLEDIVLPFRVFNSLPPPVCACASVYVFGSINRLNVFFPHLMLPRCINMQEGNGNWMGGGKLLGNVRARSEEGKGVCALVYLKI